MHVLYPFPVKVLISGLGYSFIGIFALNADRAQRNHRRAEHTPDIQLSSWGVYAPHFSHFLLLENP